MEKRIVKSGVLWLCFMVICPSMSFAAFTYIVKEAYYDFQLELDNQSVLVEGAGVKKIIALNNSYIEVQDTLPLQSHIGGIEQIDLRATSSMNFYNGQIRVLNFSSSNVANIYGGNISDALCCYKDGVVNVLGGHVELLYVNESTVTLSGGNISSIAMGFNVSDNASIAFVCDLNSLNYSYNQGLLVGVTGNWLDGSSFNVEIQNRVFTPTENYITFIPEPATLALLGFGGLLIRRKK